MAPKQKHPTLAGIGRAIRRLRTESGLTQAVLAEKADLAVETIARLEAGTADLSVIRLERVAVEGLGVPLGTLLEPPTKAGPPKSRKAVARVVALIDQLADAELEDVYQLLRLALRLGLRSGRKGGPARKRKR